MSRKIVSLNGLWNYEVNGKSMGYKQVPFSALCVGRSVCETEFVRPEGKRCFLCFEGITYAAEVFINGHCLGKMLAYSFYRFDVTALLNEKHNVLRVEVEDMNLPFGPSEGWENYGGIIRDVYLLVTDDVMIEDVIWRTEVEADQSAAQCTVEVELNGGEGNVKVTLHDHFGRPVFCTRQSSKAGKAILRFGLDNPQLWSPDMPCLYSLTVGVGTDEVTERVGIKDFRAVGQRFFLNGQPLFLKGVCRHDLYGDVGHTIKREQAERDMRLIKATGCNFVRLVHYPHDRQILELADEIGLLVSEEPGLWWSNMHRPETTKGALEVMRRVVKRDRNRVSVAFWLCFNECEYTPEFIRRSSDTCRALDPTRMVSGANCLDYEATKREFALNGFDFYTMHPYGSDLDKVQGGPGNKMTSIQDILGALNDKPLLFTEWGGMNVNDNPKLFKRFQSAMLDAWLEADGGKVLAGSCYWAWADMYEFGRGEYACYDGRLWEGLVDMYRQPRENLRVFSALMHDSWPVKEQQYGEEILHIHVEHPEELQPIDCWQAQDVQCQKEAYAELLRRCVPQKNFTQKRNRRLTKGPALQHDFCRLGSLPVKLQASQPLVVEDALTIPVNKSVSELFVVGNVSLPWGYPIYGEYGEAAAMYELKYADGTVQTVELRNGQELTTVLAIAGPSRINPVAANAETALHFHYDKNWEHYSINLFRIKTDAGKQLSELRVRVTNPEYTLLFYGVTVRML